MVSLLNHARPSVFCPGCSHDKITHALDRCFQNMGLRGDQIVMVSDIGCSGLFDTFFHTHAFHGLHGRALTYATGLKLAKPDMEVLVTMGDGGMGIGGAHFLSACRRNLNLTLLVLNNFNFGMTGGQYSATTPAGAYVDSSFLNRLERPLDVCEVAQAAGATYVTRCSSYQNDLPEEIERAIRHDGFSVLDILGICTGRYLKKNKLTPQIIEEDLKKSKPCQGPVVENTRKEYGRCYRETASGLKPASPPKNIEKAFYPPNPIRHEVVFLGSAGQRILTAGEILCYAGLTAGLHASQKSEYNITVLTGPSVTEVILSPGEIGYTGIQNPDVILALAHEGVTRRKSLFAALDEKTVVLKASDVKLPPTRALVWEMDLNLQKIKNTDRGLASLAVLSMVQRVISPEMLRSSLNHRFKGEVLDASLKLVDNINATFFLKDERGCIRTTDGFRELLAGRDNDDSNFRI